MSVDEMPNTDEPGKISGMTEVEFPDWAELVGECIQAISEVHGVIGKALIPTVLTFHLVLLRTVLGFYLSSKFENRLWKWAAWRVALHLPKWVLLRLPARWLVWPEPIPNVLDIGDMRLGTLREGRGGEPDLTNIPE